VNEAPAQTGREDSPTRLEPGPRGAGGGSMGVRYANTGVIVGRVRAPYLRPSAVVGIRTRLRRHAQP
jgi:hypothetical protein